MAEVKGIAESVLFVDDLEGVAAFYEKVLGLELVERSERGRVFHVGGDQFFLLVSAAAARAGGTAPDGNRIPPSAPPGREAPGPGHVAFSIDPDDLDAWRARLEAAGIEIASEVRWQSARSFYFRDPEGNLLELVTPGLWRSPAS